MRREGLSQIKVAAGQFGDADQMPDDPPHRPRVTIVEDDISLLNALSFALEEEGFAVMPFNRGAGVARLSRT